MPCQRQDQRRLEHRREAPLPPRARLSCALLRHPVPRPRTPQTHRRIQPEPFPQTTGQPPPFLPCWWWDHGPLGGSQAGVQVRLHIVVVMRRSWSILWLGVFFWRPPRPLETPIWKPVPPRVLDQGETARTLIEGHPPPTQTAEIPFKPSLESTYNKNERWGWGTLLLAGWEGPGRHIDRSDLAPSPPPGF